MTLKLAILMIAYLVNTKFSNCTLILSNSAITNDLVTALLERIDHKF